jgi:eukaryotic-like serine/threonine-protein kinase
MRETEHKLEVRGGAPARQSLAGRVALFGAAWGAVSGFGVASHLVATLLLGRTSTLLESPFLLHAGSCLVPVLIWALCRVPRSVLFCRVAEGVGLIASAAAIAMMGAMLAESASAEAVVGIESGAAVAAVTVSIHKRLALIVVFAACMMLTVRSALVPSRTKHTVALGAAMAAPIIAIPVAWYRLPEGAAAQVLTNLAVSTASSWGVAIAVCAVLSSVIYGLHEDVEKARRLGQYTLEEKIGEGGMGVVYRARHAFLRRPTAVKLLPPARVGEGAIQRFEREVQITAELKHPNTITVYDYGHTPEGVFYYAMELLDGPTLQRLVERTGAQSPARVVHVLRMITGALIEAHGRGLIHRDIKPANIVLSERADILEVATILDFGLAREIDRPKDDRIATFDGTIVGTPLYLAPETILSADAVDARSDIYALGAVAYFMLTGQTVFDGKTVVEVCSHHLHSPVVSPSARAGEPIPPDLDALIVRCLAKDPNARPATAKILEEELVALDVEVWTAAEADAWWNAKRSSLA